MRVGVVGDALIQTEGGDGSFGELHVGEGGVEEQVRVEEAG